MAHLIDGRNTFAPSIRDTEGRPLLERRAPADSRQRIAFDLRECPYKGSRLNHEHLMNWSAFQQVNRHWSDIKAIIDATRRLCLQKVRPEARDASSQLWTAVLLQSIPGFLASRHREEGYVLPGVAAAIFKVAIGLVSMTSRTCALAWSSYGTDAQQLTPEESVTLAERGGQLVGVIGVCAAPAGMIRDTLEILENGLSGLNGLPDGARENRSLEDLVSDVDAFFAFGTCKLARLILHDVLDLQRRVVIDRAVQHPMLRKAQLRTDLVKWLRDEPSLRSGANKHITAYVRGHGARKLYLEGVRRLCARTEDHVGPWMTDGVLFDSEPRGDARFVAMASTMLSGIPASTVDGDARRTFAKMFASQLAIDEQGAGVLDALVRAESVALKRDAMPESFAEAMRETIGSTIADFVAALAEQSVAK